MQSTFGLAARHSRERARGACGRGGVGRARAAGGGRGLAGPAGVAARCAARAPLQQASCVRRRGAAGGSHAAGRRQGAPGASSRAREACAHSSWSQLRGGLGTSGCAAHQGHCTCGHMHVFNDHVQNVGAAGWGAPACGPRLACTRCWCAHSRARQRQWGDPQYQPLAASLKMLVCSIVS